MSLTILVHHERPTVGIAKWFLDPKVSVSYATGPITEMSLEEFRATGWDWIRRHFNEYARRRISEEEAIPVFEPGQEKKYLKDRHAVRVRVEDSGNLTLIPQTFGRYALAGLESLGAESRRTIPADTSAEKFWKAFDEVLAVATKA